VEREVARTPRAPAGGLAALLHLLLFLDHGQTEKPWRGFRKKKLDIELRNLV